jgi:enamine deaminase RidA (YjgF/YER057c/UK114 family)
MAIKRISITEPPGPRMSRAVVSGSNVYLAGLTAQNTSQDITGQTQQVLAAIDSFLKEAGTDKSKLLQAQIWLTYLANYTAINAVWNDWVDPRNPPARACVRSEFVRPEILIEIMVTASLE